jgi:predicted lipoprotein with Yx(FWY)xxD motif
MQKRALILLVAVLVVGGGAYAIFHKSPKVTPAASTSTSTPPSQTPVAASSAVVQTKTNSSVGSYLANSSGSALYTYGLDTSGTSNCSGSCLYSWPAYAALSSSALPTNVTIINRSDGGKQYAYKSMPLYTFSGDSPGQVTGDGVSNFHITKP